MSTTKYPLLLIAFILLMASCNNDLEDDNSIDPGQGNQSFSVYNDPGSMSAKVSNSRQSINIRSIGSGRFESMATLTLVSSVSSPTIDGESVMANAISESGSNIVVSYNTAGNEYGGAAVILSRTDDQLTASSEVIFYDADLSHAIIDNDRLFMGGAVEDNAPPAWVASFALNNGQIDQDSYIETELGGFVATSITNNSNSIFVTTGAGENSGSGLFELDPNSLNILNQINMSDSRWIDVLGDRVYVQNGIPGGIEAFENMASLNSFSTSDADLDAKSSFDILDEYVFVAAGRNGVEIYHINGELQGTIDLPENSNSDFTTNAVAVYANLVFISNGTTVYVASYADDDSVIPEVVGELELGDFESVNHILFQDNYLIVASGTGGIKVIELELEEEEPIEGSILSRENMRIIYVNSEEPRVDKLAEYVLDGDLNTHWHTEWVETDPVHPHELWVDMGQEYELTEFRYTARQLGNFNGTVKDYDLYITNDTTAWGEPFHTGVFEKTRDEQIVVLDSAVNGRYFRFLSRSEVHGNPWTSCSEINFVGR